MYVDLEVRLELYVDLRRHRAVEAPCRERTMVGFGSPDLNMYSATSINKLVFHYQQEIQTYVNRHSNITHDESPYNNGRL